MFALRYLSGSGRQYAFAGQTPGPYADGAWFFNFNSNEAGTTWVSADYDLAFWAAFGVSGKSCGADVSVLWFEGESMELNEYAPTNNRTPPRKPPLAPLR